MTLKEATPMKIELEQRIDLRVIAPNKWRLVGYVGRAMFFYAEVGAEAPPFSCSSEFAAADVGQWRAIDGTRRLVVGQGGKAQVTPKEGGQKGEVQVTFQGVGFAL
jgi:hypothetical protein